MQDMPDLKQLFPFPVTLQTTLARKEDLPAFTRTLALLQALGFAGVELNLPDLQTFAPKELHDLLARYGLRMTYLATGAYAKARGLSLSAPGAAARAAACAGVQENLAYAAAMGCGVILGFFKGTPLPDAARAQADLADSLARVCARAPGDVPILIEATNRRETSVVHTVAQADALAARLGDDRLRVLPDTYHMYYEEADGPAAVRAALGRVPNLHLSDDNRYFPGYGAIDFSAWVRALLDMGYKGTCGVEGNLHTDLETDLVFTAQALARAAAKA